jgi:NAD(P) transhydrogenase
LDYDLVVIGAGPAGEKGAAHAAYFGKRVAVIEREPYPGGAGINTGTVPSKTLRETALYFSGLSQRGLYGIDYQVKANLTVRELMYRQQEVVTENIDRHKIDLTTGAPCSKTRTRSGSPARASPTAGCGATSS